MWRGGEWCLSKSDILTKSQLVLPFIILTRTFLSALKFLTSPNNATKQLKSNLEGTSDYMVHVIVCNFCIQSH